jgi:hypothetical protein
MNIAAGAAFNTQNYASVAASGVGAGGASSLLLSGAASAASAAGAAPQGVAPPQGAGAEPQQGAGLQQGAGAQQGAGSQQAGSGAQQLEACFAFSRASNPPPHPLLNNLPLQP